MQTSAYKQEQILYTLKDLNETQRIDRDQYYM